LFVALDSALDVVGLNPLTSYVLASSRSLTQISESLHIPYPRLRRQLMRAFEMISEELPVEKWDAWAHTPEIEKLRKLWEKLRSPVRQNNVFKRNILAKDMDELRTMQRAKLAIYLEQGIRSRKQLYQKNTDLVFWCRTHDAQWFDAVLPAIPHAERKGVGRRRTRF